ncbi:MAG TPA: hypothetical protein VIX59_20910 [Candidatus Binataceae bacterium]
MWFAPERAVGALVFINTSTAPPDGLAFALIRQAADASEPAVKRPMREQPTLWNEFCGTYRALKGFNSNLRLWALGGALRIFVRKGRLMIGGRHPFGPVRCGIELHAADAGDPLLFRAELRGIEGMVLFRRNSDGRVDSMNFGASAGAFLSMHKRVRIAETPTIGYRWNRNRVKKTK